MPTIKKHGPAYFYNNLHVRRYRYFRPVHVNGGASWVFAWSTERAFLGPHASKYIAFICKYNPEIEGWEKVKEVGRAARWRAKDQAYRWLCKKTGQTFHSLHKKRVPTDVQKLRWLTRRALKKRKAEREAKAADVTDGEQVETNKATDPNDMGGE